MYGVDATTVVLDDFEAGNVGSQGSFHLADANRDGFVCMPELSAYIDSWKYDNQVVTIVQLIDGIAEWKRTSGGCS
jgi:hypothetical protein